MKTIKMEYTNSVEMIKKEVPSSKYYRCIMNDIVVNIVVQRKTAMNWIRRRKAKYIKTTGHEACINMFVVVEVKTRRIK